MGLAIDLEDDSFKKIAINVEKKDGLVVLYNQKSLL
jgi:hypothetical protein